MLCNRKLLKIPVYLGFKNEHKIWSWRLKNSIRWYVPKVDIKKKYIKQNEWLLSKQHVLGWKLMIKYTLDVAVFDLVLEKNLEGAMINIIY